MGMAAFRASDEARRPGALQFAHEVLEASAQGECRLPAQVLLRAGNIQWEALGVGRLARLDLIIEGGGDGLHGLHHIRERRDKAIADVEALIRQLDQALAVQALPNTELTVHT